VREPRAAKAKLFNACSAPRKVGQLPSRNLPKIALVPNFVPTAAFVLRFIALVLGRRDRLRRERPLRAVEPDRAAQEWCVGDADARGHAGGRLAHMVMASLAWTLKAWFALELPSVGKMVHRVIGWNRWVGALLRRADAFRRPLLC